MSSICRPGASHATPASSTANTAPTAKVDLLISLQLHAWPALTLAVQNYWGGPGSGDKRDWLAGAISDLISNGDVVDAQDLEEVLIQVMLDEFEVVVDDESPGEVASKIMNGRQRILQGDSGGVDQLLARWTEKQQGGQENVIFQRIDVSDDNQETDWESSAGEDMEVEEAPQLVLVSVPEKEKLEPEVDEDGFTKVIGKKKQR